MVVKIARKADGYVVIDTVIEKDGLERGTDEIVEACRRAADSVENIGEKAKIAMQKSVNAFAKQNEQYRLQEQKVKDLRAELERLKNTQIESEEYKAVNAEISRLENKLVSIDKKKAEAFAMGEDEFSKRFDKWEYEADQVIQAIDALKRKKAELEGTGGAYTAQDTSVLSATLEKEELRLKQMGRTVDTSYASIREATAKTHELGNAHKKTGKSIGSFEQNTKKSLKSILKYALGVESLFFLVNKIRNALGEGFKNLAQYSGEVNESISGVKSSLFTLKNSLATAFAPVLNAIAPVLKKIIDWISKAASYVSMFFAVLEGKDTYTRAKAVQLDYAESLEGTAGAMNDVKKAAKNLSGLDELNIWQSASAGASGGGGGSSGNIAPEDMFEEVPIENASDLKKKFEGILEVVEAVAIGLAAWKVASSFIGDLDSVGSKIGKMIGGSIMVAAGITFLISNMKAVMSGKYENTSLNSAINTLIGGFLTGAGFALLSGVSLGIALPVAMVLSFAITDLVVNWDENYKPATQKLIEAIGDFFAGDLESASAALQERIKYIYTADSWNVEITDALLGEGVLESALEAMEKDENLFLKIFSGWHSKSGIGDYYGNTGSQFEGLSEAALEAQKNVDAAMQGISATTETNSRLVAQSLATCSNDLAGSTGKIKATTLSNFGSMNSGATKETKALASTSKSNFSSVRTNASTYFGKASSESKKTWSSTYSSLKTTWANMSSKSTSSFGGMRSSIVTIFTSLKSKLKTPINGIISFLNNMISGVTTMVNRVIQSLNSLSITVPKWVPTYGGKKFGFNLSTVKSYRIPYLATGAVIPPNREFMAVLGDQKHGTNIETPEGLLRKIIREELGSRGGSYEFVAQINRRTLFDEVIAESRLRKQTTGKNPFLV